MTGLNKWLGKRDHTFERRLFWKPNTMIKTQKMNKSSEDEYIAIEENGASPLPIAKEMREDGKDDR